ncbi:MAG: response regulator [Pseudomonadota bacterium]
MIDIHEMAVLIIDDMVTMCKSIHNMMKVLGYGKKIMYANNGKEALNVLKKEEIDLVFLDYNMPGMTGAELLSQIREDRTLRHLPVIMVTAEAYGDFVAEAAESDIDAYMLKPLTIQLLDQKINRVVEKANNPPPAVAHSKRAMHFEEEGNIEAAIEEAKLAMEAAPNSSKPIRELGYYYFKNNKLEEAEKWLLKAAAVNNLDVFAFHHLGELYLKRNDIEKAQHYFEKAMNISPRHLSRGINFGKTLVKRGMAARAIQVFDKAFQLQGSTLEMREDIAKFCIENEVYEYAVKLLETIVTKQPDRADLFFELGKALEKLGYFQDAIGYLAEAEKRDKENMDIKLHMAKDYLALERKILAEKTLKKVLKIEPENKEAYELLKQCI